MMPPDYKPKIGGNKKQQLAMLEDNLKKYKTIAVINLENLPAAQFQKIRAKIREKVLFQIAKKQVILRALENTKDKKIQELIPLLKGVPALLLTNESAPSLNVMLQQQQTSAPAKAGQIAPYDLAVPAGPTPFTPGPMIGELGQLRIKTEVKEGKINIREEKLIVKKDEAINGKIADLLAKLGIEPVKIGISLQGAIDNGILFSHEVLSITPEQYLEQITAAVQHAFNLAVFAQYPASPQVTEMLIQKAQREANAVSSLANMPPEPQTSATEPSPQQPPTVSESKPEENNKPQSTDVQQASVAAEQLNEGSAKEIIKKLQDGKIKADHLSAENKPNKPKQYSQLGEPKDINTLINDLKDRTTKGEN